MFTLLKIFQQLVTPPAVLLIAFMIGFWCLKRTRRMGRIILLVTIAAFYVISIEPTAYLFERTVVRQIPHIPVHKIQDVQAIVVLGGGADTEEGRVFPELGGVSWKRFWRGIEVYHALDGAVPILYVGGSGDPFHSVSKEAELAQSYAMSIGIPEGQFWIESHSRDTYENGVAVKRILEEQFSKELLHRVVLVTSAIHMPRASRVFKKLGMSTLPAPADLSLPSLRLDVLSFIPSVSSLSSSVGSIHEWMGQLGYTLRDRI